MEPRHCLSAYVCMNVSCFSFESQIGWYSKILTGCLHRWEPQDQLAKEKLGLGVEVPGGEWQSDSDEEEFFRREAEDAQKLAAATGSQRPPEAGEGGQDAESGVISTFLENVTVE
jgi:hypothetical protein